MFSVVTEISMIRALLGSSTCRKFFVLAKRIQRILAKIQDESHEFTQESLKVAANSPLGGGPRPSLLNELTH